MDDDSGVAHAHRLGRLLDENPNAHGKVIKEFFAERDRDGDRTGAAYALIFQKIVLEKRNVPLEQVSPLLRLMVILGFIAGLTFAGLGIWLVALNASGDTEFSFFGQTFKSANVGIAAIFLGAATIVLLARSVLKTIRHYKP
jgi:hypothetical protein